MNWIDCVILGILFISFLIGLVRGLISEVLSLVIWVAAFWVAWTYGPSLAHYFESSVSLPSARVAIGYGLCFIAVLLVGGLIRFMISRLVASTGLGGTDRLFGMLFGLARGVLIVALVVFIVGFTPLANSSMWQESAMMPQFRGAAEWLGQQIPEHVRGYMHPPAALENMEMPDVKLPSKDDLMKLRDMSLPAQPTTDNVHPAAATTAATS